MLLWGIGRIPDRAVLAVGAAVGGLLGAMLPRYRRAAQGNLERAFGGQLSAREIERMVARNFRHLGGTLAEFLRMPAWDDAEIERRVALRGTDHLDAALAAGRGVIAVSAHYGNWELMGARLVRAGYPICVLARDADDPATNALIGRIRQSGGYQVISRRNGLRGALAFLRNNGIATFLLDQNTSQGEVYVEFFGHLAATARGPALLARHTGAPLIPAFDRRLADGTHVVEILPPVEWEASQDKERDVWEITARLTRIIEAQIRADPEQWLWIHQRWKQQPTEPPSAG
jgi:Kdo2-lipid IVA lauroyltransferase/acyltransferase